MKIYCIFPTEARGVPIDLEGVLSESFNEKDPMPPMDQEWNQSMFAGKLDFPRELWLICKEKLLSFDYYPHFNGFIISKEFYAVLKDFNKEDYQTIPLKTISWKGKHITDKEYYYIQFHVGESCVDYELSEYELRKRAQKEKVFKLGFGISHYKKIELKKDCTDKNIFLINDIILSNYMFCTESSKREIESRDFYGFEFLTLDEFTEAYNNRYSNIF